MRLFVDTWGWLVLEDHEDPLHERVVQCYEEWRRKSGRVLTSNFVLDETFTLLFRRRPFDEAWRFSNGLVSSRSIGVELIDGLRFRRTLQLREKLADKPKISFTDLSSMTLMNELKATDILTGDAHFRHVGLGFNILPD
ncbi:MAG: PIN domain-containing protein [Candidatus Acidiferrales bacterium]